MSRLILLRFLLAACVSLPLSCQTAQIILNQNWITTGDTQPVQLTFSSSSPDLYGLIASGAVAADWNGTMLPLQFLNGDVAEFNVPAAVRVPGFTEFSLWNTNTQQELPYSAFIPVLLPIPATNTFVVNQASDRIAADIPAFATSAGTDQIQVYQLSTGTLVQSFPLGAGQAMLAFTPDAQYAWVATNAGLGQWARMNLATQGLDQMIQFPATSFPYKITGQVDPTSQ